MEISYCTLSTLSNAIRKCGKSFTENEMMILLYKISAAFYELQKIGIAHRDIKPDNIMIDEEIEKIKIIDIGESEYSTLDKETELECVGSPFFMAPEVLMLKTNENMKVFGNYIKSDVYSTALSIINIHSPDLSLKKEDRNKDEDEKITITRDMMIEILENKI